MAFNIAANLQPSAVKSAAEMEEAFLNNEAKKMQNALTAQEMDIRGADMEAQKNFNALMDQAGGDYNKALEMAPDWRTKELIGGKISQRQAAQQDEQLKQFDRGMKEIEFGAQIMGTVKDQASYDMARQRMAQYGLKVESMPDNYDPNYVDSMVNSAMSFKDRIAQQKLDYEARRIEQGDQRLGLMEQRLMQQNQGGGVDTTKGWTIKETANGLVRVNEYTGEVAPVQMNGQTLQGKPSASAAKPVVATEDERKAAGWLEQARLAKSNMDSVLKENPDAAKPTLKELALKSVLPESVEQVSYSPERQRFTQAASQMSEATLRAATGAGVNKDEALQKIKELTPQYGDSDDVIKQKMESQDMYLKSLEARAGRAALPQQDQQQAPQLSGQDAEALQWAQQNANDPRAQAIMRRLGR